MCPHRLLPTDGSEFSNKEGMAAKGIRGASSIEDLAVTPTGSSPRCASKAGATTSSRDGRRDDEARRHPL